MILFTLSPVFALGWPATLLLVALMGGLLWTKPPQKHNPERAYRRLELKLRHPWKARMQRWTGVE